MTEQFVVIAGHPCYEISNYGTVRNKYTGRILKANPNRPGGYLRVLLDGKQCYIHRLVAENFIGFEIGKKARVSHRDGDRSNNCLNNLVW